METIKEIEKPLDGNAPTNGTKSRLHRLVIFSDIDGTLVHYPKANEKLGFVSSPSVLSGAQVFVEMENGRKHKVLTLPPASSGDQGIISWHTLEELASMRQTYHAGLVLVTGARLSTLLERLPFLPAADAYICENGGRILLHDESRKVAAPIVEDMEWRGVHNETAGPAYQEGKPPSERNGTLWQLCQRMIDDGWHIDWRSYTTSFRVRLDNSKKTDADLQRLREGLPKDLRASFNLSHLDIYPATSGKRNAAAYMLPRLGACPESALFLCDDDNDLELADFVPKVFLPSITSESLRKTAEANPEKFVIATKQGFLATEEILVKVKDYCGTFVLG